MKAISNLKKKKDLKTGLISFLNFIWKGGCKASAHAQS